MAIKYTSDSHESGIPTLTEIVTDDEPSKSPPPKPAIASASPGRATPAPEEPAPAIPDGIPLPPKFDKTLEKLIYKKLHQQLLALSQGLAAEVLAELQKHPPQTAKAAKKSAKTGD